MNNEQVCVESCPNEVKSFWVDAQPENPLYQKDKVLKEMEPYCDPEDFSKDKDPIELINEKICPAWYASIRAVAANFS